MLIAFYERIKSFFVGIVYIINYKINENDMCFILFFSAKLYLSPVSYSFALTFFSNLNEIVSAKL